MATLPATTPQAFKQYANAHLKGDDGKPGGSVAELASLGYAGQTVGDQWLSFYSAKQGQFGSAYTLLQYEEAFVALWTEAALGNDLAHATGATGQIIQADATGIGKGISQVNKDLGGLPAAAAGAYTAVTSWEQALGGFVGALGQANTWIRVVKVIAGGTLLIVGLVHITGADGTVASAARKVPLPI